MPIYNSYYPDPSNHVGTPQASLQLVLQGPTIPVTVGLTPQHVAILQRLGLPIPLPVSGLALIDTGASLCAVDVEAIKGLRIPQFGTSLIVTPSGASQQPTYPASLSFPGTPLANITFADFIGCPLRASGIIALIGRNVLMSFVLVYNGLGGHVSLAY